MKKYLNRNLVFWMVVNYDGLTHLNVNGMQMNLFLLNYILKALFKDTSHKLKLSLNKAIKIWYRFSFQSNVLLFVKYVKLKWLIKLFFFHNSIQKLFTLFDQCSKNFIFIFFESVRSNFFKLLTDNCNVL